MRNYTKMERKLRMIESKLNRLVESINLETPLMKRSDYDEECRSIARQLIKNYGKPDIDVDDLAGCVDRIIEAINLTDEMYPEKMNLKGIQDVLKAYDYHDRLFVDDGQCEAWDALTDGARVKTSRKFRAVGSEPRLNKHPLRRRTPTEVVDDVIETAFSKVDDVASIIAGKPNVQKFNVTSRDFPLDIIAFIVNCFWHEEIK